MNSAVSCMPLVRQKMDQGRGVGASSIGCNQALDAMYCIAIILQLLVLQVDF